MCKQNSGVKVLKNKKNIPSYRLYDIIPSQNAMYLMYKFGIHKQQAQIPTSYMPGKVLDFNVLQKAFAVEIKRNDSLRLKFTKQDGKIKQYFTGDYEYKVPVKYFFSEQEQNEFFEADAPKPVSFLKDETFRIYFFRTAHKGVGIYTNFSHLVMDAMGIVIFYLDLLNVYDSIENNKPLPPPLNSYEDYIIKNLEKNADEKKEAKHEAFFKEYFARGGEPFYAGVHGPALLEKFRKKKKNPHARVPIAYNPLHDKCDMLIRKISKEDTDKIIAFCEEKQISPESVFQLGLRTYCSAINYRTEDVCMMSVCSNRTNYKEKNMSGCMAQPLILRTIIPEASTFDEALQSITDVRTALYRHSLYPYTKARDMFLKMYNFAPVQGANSMMFSWIPLPLGTDIPEESEFRTYNLRSYFTPLYAMVTPDSGSGGICIYYMYRVKLSGVEDIERLHKNTLNIILEGISNPDIKISRLLDGVT